MKEPTNIQTYARLSRHRWEHKETGETVEAPSLVPLTGLVDHYCKTYGVKAGKVVSRNIQSMGFYQLGTKTEEQTEEEKT